LRAPSFAPLRIDLKAPFGLLDGFGVLGLGVGLLMGVGARQENPRSPLILLNGEYQVNPI